MSWTPPRGGGPAGGGGGGGGASLNLTTWAAGATANGAAAAAPLPAFAPPRGQRGEDILIVWDFQNVRIPDELDPEDVMRFLRDTFVLQAGPRRCCGCYASFTDQTKLAVGERRFNKFTSNGVGRGAGESDGAGGGQREQ